MTIRFKVKEIACLILSLYYTAAGAQSLDRNHFLDSLNHVVATGKTDSIKARATYLIADEWAYSDIETAKKYLREAKQLSGKSNYLAAVNTFYEAGVYYDTFPDRAAALYLIAQHQFRKFTSEEALIFRAKSWRNYGALLQKKDDQDGFLTAVLHHALPLAKQAGNCYLEGSYYSDIGMIFMNQVLYSKAEAYFLKSLNRLENCGGQGYEKRVETTILLAKNYCFMDQLPEAKAAIDRFNALLEHRPRGVYHLDAMEVEGIYYRKHKESPVAVQVLKDGIALADSLGKPYAKKALTFQLYMAYSDLGDYQNALQALKQSVEDRKFSFLETDAMYALYFADIYERLNDLPNAYSWLKEYVRLKDSITTRNMKSTVSELEIRYNTAEKERDVTLLRAKQQKQQFLSWLLGIGALLFLVVVIFLYYVYRNNKKQNAQQLRKLEQAKELELTQAMLTGEERERRRLARELHDGLGGALTGIKLKLSSQQKQLSTPALNESIYQLENSIEELRQISRAMMPESLVKSGLEVALQDLCASWTNEKLDVEFQSNGLRISLSMEKQVHIYRMTQELISNAIRHGHASKIIVQCIQSDNKLFITVEDNGTGFDKNKMPAPSGIGLDNVRNRVNYLHGTLEIASNVGEGTTVNIEIYV